jgi:glucose uptake protein
MILPASHVTVFILLIFGMLCWGLWANTFKATGPKWRFELFYFDFAIGTVIAALVLALTAGTLGFDGFSFFDDIRLAGKRQDLSAFIAGSVFNLGNMLLLAALSVAGMSVAFPLAMGFALIIAGFWNFALNPGGNLVLMSIGAIVLLGAVVLGAMAAKASTVAAPAAAVAGAATTVKTKPTKKSSAKSVFLSLAGGLLLGSFSPLVQMARVGDNGLGAYSFGFIFTVGIVFSTFVFNLFFMNLPVQGEPIDIAEYFRAKFRLHALGFLGGILWYCGTLAVLVAGKLDPPAGVAASLSYGIPQGAIVIAGLCGLLLWKEFDSAEASIKIRVGMMLILVVVGLGLSAASLAPAP